MGAWPVALLKRRVKLRSGIAAMRVDLAAAERQVLAPEIRHHGYAGVRGDEVGVADLEGAGREVRAVREQLLGVGELKRAVERESQRVVLAGQPDQAHGTGEAVEAPPVHTLRFGVDVLRFITQAELVAQRSGFDAQVDVAGTHYPITAMAMEPKK